MKFSLIGLALGSFALGGAAQAADFSFKVNPKSTFLMTSANDTGALAPLKIRLSDYGISAGDIITLTQTGNYYYDPAQKLTGSLMIGVFSRTDQVLAASLQARIPGALRAGPAGFSLPSYTGAKGWTDIPEDFCVPSTATKIAVPSGAQFLFVAPSDTYYTDNADIKGYGLTLSVTAKATGATRNYLKRILPVNNPIRSGAYGVAPNGTVAGYTAPASGARLAATMGSGSYANYSALGTGDSVMNAIANSGDMVGFATSAKGTLDAFLLTKKGVATDLWANGSATAINNSGSIAGFQAAAPGRPLAMAVVKDKVVTIENSLSTTGRPTGMNERGDIVGFSVNSNGYPIPWQASTSDKNGPSAALLSFKTPPAISPYAYPAAINNGGTILVNYLSANNIYRSYIYDSKGYHDLGTLPGGLMVEGMAINNKGQVVGAATTSEGEVHAFLYDGSKMIDLGTLDGNASWATAISDNGLIVGTGLDASGRETAFQTYGAPTFTTSLTLNGSSVKGGASVQGTVNIGVAQSSDVTVGLSSSSNDAKVPSSVTVKAGATTATFTVSTSAVGTSESVTVTAAANSSTSSQSLTLLPVAVKSVSFDPASVTEGSATKMTVTLDGASSSGDVPLTFASDPKALVSFPTNTSVPAGKTSYTFVVTAGAATKPMSGTVTVSNSTGTASAKLTVNPINGISAALSSNYFREGSTSNLTLTIPGPAPVGGKTVALTSTNNAVSMPATAVIPEGAKQVVVAMLANATEKNLPFTASAMINAANTKVAATTRSLTLQSLQMAKYTASPNSSVTGTFQLEAPALSKGKAVKLWTNNSSATVDASVNVPAGKQAGAFTLKVGKIAKGTKITIYAQCGDRESRTIVVQIQ